MAWRRFGRQHKEKRIILTKIEKRQSPIEQNPQEGVPSSHRRADNIQLI